MGTILDTPKVNYPINSIRFRNLVIFGEQGIGKTETVRAIIEKAVEYYGQENVHAIIAESGKLDWVLDYGLNNRKLVQILFIDNITLVENPESIYQRFFKIRHEWLGWTDRPYGYIITILGSHRFHGVPMEVRTNLNAVIIMNDTMNPYDHALIKRYVSDDGIKDLEELEHTRYKVPGNTGISLFKIRSGVLGLLNLGMAKKNYMERLLVPIG